MYEEPGARLVVFVIMGNLELRLVGTTSGHYSRRAGVRVMAGGWSFTFVIAPTHASPFAALVIDCASVWRAGSVLAAASDDSVRSQLRTPAAAPRGRLLRTLVVVVTSVVAAS